MKTRLLFQAVMALAFSFSSLAQQKESQVPVSIPKELVGEHQGGMVLSGIISEGVVTYAENASLGGVKISAAGALTTTGARTLMFSKINNVVEGNSVEWTPIQEKGILYKARLVRFGAVFSVTIKAYKKHKLIEATQYICAEEN